MKRKEFLAAVHELAEQLGSRLYDLVDGESERLRAATLGIDTAHGMTPCGVLLDPPYAHDAREKRLYREDSAELSAVARAWAIEHGDNPALRIALCGWEGEHAMPAGWTLAAWKSKGSGKNRGKERIWFSPHCLPMNQGDLFGRGGGGGGEIGASL